MKGKKLRIEKRLGAARRRPDRDVLRRAPQRDDPPADAAVGATFVVTSPQDVAVDRRRPDERTIASWMSDLNPVWILVILTAGAAIARGLFWLRDVHHGHDQVPGLREGDPGRVQEGPGRVQGVPERHPRGDPGRGPRGGRPGGHAAARGGRQPGIADRVRREARRRFLRAKEWATATATPLVQKVVNKRPFEIEDFSRRYVAERLDPDIQERVSVCAYEFGIETDSVRVCPLGCLARRADSPREGGPRAKRLTGVPRPSRLP